MTPEQARALLGLPEPTEKPYERQAHILKPPMPEVTNRPRSGKVGAISDFLAGLDKRARSAQNAAVDYLMPQGGPNVPFPVGLSLYPTMTSSGEINQPKGLETVPLPLADIAKTIQASDLMGIGGAGRALDEISYGDLPKDAYDFADMALLAPGIAGLLAATGRTAKGAGRAAKGLAQSEAGYRLANRVADATGASGLPIIKNPGGNWLSSVDDTTRVVGPEGLYRNHLGDVGRDQARMDDALERAEWFAARFGPDNELARSNLAEAKELEGRIAAHRWANGPLKKYIRNDLATENDPIRKLIEQGISHLTQTDFDAARASGVNRRAENHRAATGFPQYGISGNTAGSAYEAIADAAIRPLSVEQIMHPNFAGQAARDAIIEQNPWLMKLYNDSTLNPKPMTYQKDLMVDSTHLGFGKLIDNIVSDVAAGRLDPKDINKYTVEAAVTRAHNIQKEKEAELARQLAASRADLPVHREYPEGYKWVELNKPGSFATESDAMSHSVRGYEPEQGHPDWVPLSGTGGRSSYGHGGWEAIKSGKAKVYSLVDENGKPHVTVETKIRPFSEGRFISSYLDRGKTPTAEEIAQARSAVPEMVTQVKRFENDVGPEDYPQRQFVTDFMRHKNFNLSDLGSDIDNTGLVRYSSRLSPEQVKTLVAGGHDVPEYLTRQELAELSAKLPPPPPRKSYALQSAEEEDRFHGRDPYNDMPGPEDPMWLENRQDAEADEAFDRYANGQYRVIGGGRIGGVMDDDDMPNMLPYEGYKEGGEVHAAGGGMIKALAMINKALQEARAAGKTIESVSTDRIGMAHKDVTKRVPELTAAAKLLEEGKITKEQYAEMVRMFKPVQPFAEMPRMATKEEMLQALAENQRDKLYLPRNLEEGTPVGGRLNIPSYIRHNTWIPTLHEQVPGFRAGPVIGYDSHFRVGDASFGVEPKSALNYATGKTSKGTFATIKGNYKRTGEEEAMELAREMMSDPRYRQIGMDPERSSMFYDRETFEPVGEAEDVLQVGPIVFARNPKRPSKKQLEDAPFASGGLSAYKE